MPHGGCEFTYVEFVISACCRSNNIYKLELTTFTKIILFSFTYPKAL